MNATTRLTASDIGPWFSTHHHTEPEFAEYLADLLEEAFSDPPQDLLSDLRNPESEVLSEAIWEAIDALNAIAPENTYFGVSESYGDFGLWYCLEELDYRIRCMLDRSDLPHSVKAILERLLEDPEPWFSLPDRLRELREAGAEDIAEELQEFLVDEGR